jgi:hypothetical protein
MGRPGTTQPDLFVEGDRERDVGEQRRGVLVVRDRDPALAFPVNVDVLQGGELDALDVEVLLERVAHVPRIQLVGALVLRCHLLQRTRDAHVVQVHGREPDAGVEQHRQRHQQEHPANQCHPSLRTAHVGSFALRLDVS